MRRWWKWALGLLAALLAIASRRGSPWKGRAKKSQERAQEAGHGAIRDAARAAEAAANADLTQKRAQDDDIRLRNALARAAAARRRRDEGKPGGS